MSGPQHLRGTASHRPGQIVVYHEHERRGDVHRGHLFDQPSKPDRAEALTAILRSDGEARQSNGGSGGERFGPEPSLGLPILGDRGNDLVGPKAGSLDHLGFAFLELIIHGSGS